MRPGSRLAPAVALAASMGAPATARADASHRIEDELRYPIATG